MKRTLTMACVSVALLLPASAAQAEEVGPITVPEVVTAELQPGTVTYKDIAYTAGLPSDTTDITFGEVHEYGYLDIGDLDASGPIDQDDLIQPGQDWIVPVYVKGTWFAMAQMADDGHMRALGPIVGWDAQDAAILDALPETSLVVGAGALEGTFVVGSDGEELAPLDTAGEELADGDLEKPTEAEAVIPGEDVVSADALRATIITGVEELQAADDSGDGGSGGGGSRDGTSLTLLWWATGILAAAGLTLIGRGIIQRRRRTVSPA